MVIRELRPPVALYVTRAMPLGVVTHPIRVTTVVVKWLAVLGSSDHADPTHPLSLMLSIATSNKFDSVRHYNFFFFYIFFPSFIALYFFFFFSLSVSLALAASPSCCSYSYVGVIHIYNKGKMYSERCERSGQNINS